MNEYIYIFYTFEVLINRLDIMITQKDCELLAQKGISEQQISRQLECFEQGIPYLEIASAASAGKGILVPNEKDINLYLTVWDAYMSLDHEVVKFVPASGAASRMFKDLFSFLDSSSNEPTTSFEKEFFARINQFAFYDELNAVCKEREQKDIPTLLAQGNYKSVVRNLLTADGLNYGSLPKALLTFHAYDGETRTPFEEHLVEGYLYATIKRNLVKIHFTVSEEHRALFENLMKKKLKTYSDRFNVKYIITFSEQKQSTDTLAVENDNTPFRDEDGSLVFRPGGHGALIENLNEIEADMVFIKNVDNVVPDSLKADTVLYKRLLGGVLAELQMSAFCYLRLLKDGVYTAERLADILTFVEKALCCVNPAVKDMEDTELVLYLINKLHRPMRVCGMVRNVGEPGGGPFWVYNADGSISLQILESSQIDMHNAEKKAMFEQGTHFNPVDLVCGITDYRGVPFDLTKYVDPSTGFISSKSKNGKALKALELPGLWNGAMSNWNTVFVEVPSSTFNPVKTVNDLLREQHQE